MGGLPQQSGSVLTPILAGISGLGFLAAVLGLFGVVIPANWWTPLVLVAVVASVLLHVLYLGRWALLPIVVDAVLLWGVLVQHWTMIGLRGS
jgi:hypothetical protein